MAGPQAGPAELSAAITRLAPSIPQLAGPLTKTAVFAGALVEWGGSPLPLAELTPARVAADLELFAIFPNVWARISGGQPLPDPEDEAAEAGVTEVAGAAAERLGLPGPSARHLATAWFHAEDWMKLIITLQAMREFRTAMASLERLRAAAAVIADRSARAVWMHALTLVLDDEPLIVLDPGSRRGFQLTMSGIGDNFQLHTLLADRLAARVRAWNRRNATGWPPPPTRRPPCPAARSSSAAAASSTATAPTSTRKGTRPTSSRSTARGSWFSTRPWADLPGAPGGLTSSCGPRSSSTANSAQPMRRGGAREAGWLARVEPARETDLMGINRR